MVSINKHGVPLPANVIKIVDLFIGARLPCG